MKLRVIATALVSVILLSLYFVYGNSIFSLMTGHSVASGNVANVADKFKENCYRLTKVAAAGDTSGAISIEVMAYDKSDEDVKLKALLALGDNSKDNIVSGYRSDVAGEGDAPLNWKVSKCTGGQTLYSSFVLNGDSSTIAITTKTTTTSSSGYCGDGIVQQPNGKGEQEYCDKEVVNGVLIQIDISKCVGRVVLKSDEKYDCNSKCV